MGLRAKFNLVLLAVALVGAVLFAFAATPILQSLAHDEVVQSSRIMMESAAGARKYTSDQITPLVEPTMGGTFRPQTVSAYAAKNLFAVLRERFHDYSYREAALNPTNPDDAASDWEADIIHDFRDHPGNVDVVTERGTPNGRMLYLARPIVARAACLTCHSTPGAAPASMIAVYGPDHGFGWKAGEVVGAQIVSVPMSVPLARAARVRTLLLIPYVGVFAALFLLLNLLLGIIVIRPIDAMSKSAEAVSMGRMDAPEYVRPGSDQIARLSRSINLMRRSLQEALRMLSEE